MLCRDGRLTVEALRHFLDTLPHVAHSGLGELLVVGDATVWRSDAAFFEWERESREGGRVCHRGWELGL